MLVSREDVVVWFLRAVDDEVLHALRGNIRGEVQCISSSPCFARYAALISRHCGVSCARRVKSRNGLYPCNRNRSKYLSGPGLPGSRWRSKIFAMYDSMRGNGSVSGCDAGKAMACRGTERSC